MKTSDLYDLAMYVLQIIKQKHEHEIAGSRSFAEAIELLNYGSTYALCRDGVRRFEVKNDGGISVCPLGDVEVTDLIAWGKWLDATGRTDPAYMVLAVRELTKLTLSTAPDHPLAQIVASLVDDTRITWE